MSECAPIIKWAGGKRQLLPEIDKRLPTNFNTYFEPFLGGAAVFLHIRPKKAVLNDFNAQLMNLYAQVQNSPQELLKALLNYQKAYNAHDNEADRTAYYIANRRRYNGLKMADIKNVETAALFIFLNKAGFNGLYRENANGLFNVPSAHRQRLWLCDMENIKEVSLAFKKATLLTGDFEKACKKAKKNDFVFFDSPYYGTFDTYQAGGFTDEDHKRLAKLFKELTDKGVFCMLTNSNEDFIKELYKDYTIDIVPVKRMINSDASNRVGEEVIITNY